MIHLVLIIFCVLLLLILYRIAYYLLTVNKTKIRVIKKYMIKFNDVDTYKIFDENKTEYILAEDILISKKQCKEIWNYINENEEYYMEYYGLNLPSININYRIIGITKVIY